jgi:arabinofuranosyltransferase
MARYLRQEKELKFLSQAFLSEVSKVKGIDKLYPYYYLLAIIIIFIIHSLYLSRVAEDAFISFRYAKNLINGHGLTWNVGESPVEGYTNFLWVIICAFALKSGFDVSRFAQVVGVLAGSLTIVYSYNFSHRLLRCKGIYSMISCLFLAISGPFATWASSGMETNFFVLFLLMSCYHFAVYWQFSSYRDLFLCFLSILVATLVRPEGIMIFSILLGMSLFLSIGKLKESLKDFLLPVLTYVVPFVAYFIWRFTYYDFLLPNTFYAKTGGSVYQYLRGAIYSGFFTFYFIFPLLPLLALYVWEKGLPLLEGKKHFRLLRQYVRDHAGVYISGIVCIVYTFYIICVGGDYMEMYRFFVPLLPFIYILFGLVTSTLLSSIFILPRKRAIVFCFMIFAMGATLLQSTPLEKKLFRKPPLQLGSYRGVQTERWHSARLSLIGKFFDGYKQYNNESLATGAIGAISYFADMRVYGLHGLVDTHIAHTTVGKNGKKVLGSGQAGHEKGDLLYLFSKKPTYFMFNRRLTMKPAEYKDVIKSLGSFIQPEFEDKINTIIQENYRLMSFWLVDRNNRQEGYFNFLQLRELRVPK